MSNVSELDVKHQNDMEEELMKCERCGQTLPRSKLERMKTGTYRRVCNHCKWLYYVKPSRDRRILRELAERHVPKEDSPV